MKFDKAILITLYIVKIGVLLCLISLLDNCLMCFLFWAETTNLKNLSLENVRPCKMNLISIDSAKEI